MNRVITAVLCGTLALILASCEKEKEIAVTSVTIGQATAEMYIGETTQFTATVLPSDATNKTVSWASSKQSVATVSSTGLVTAIAEGTSTITASAGGKSGTCTIMVSKKAIDVSSVELNKTTMELSVGDSETLVATVKPDDATDKTVTWSTSDESVATVNEGVVTAIAEGTATVTALAGGKIATCTVRITRMLEPFLTFQSEGTTTISLSNKGGNIPILFYSYDKTTWIEWDYGELSFTSESPLYMYGNNPNGFSSSYEKKSRFYTSGSGFGVSGSIMYLLEQAEGCITIPSEFCFIELFRDCINLSSAPELPAITLAPNCYYSMFEGCSSLKTAPELPAVKLAQNCYDGMFYKCTSLNTAPSLPATSLANECYNYMFSGCTSLHTPPELPASTLAQGCYKHMFANCSELSFAPVLPATSLAGGCYESMFAGCTNLITAPELPATTLEGNCYCGMFAYCTSLTYAPELPATTLEGGCYDNMFAGCTSLATAPELPATTLASRCYASMFYGCTSLTEAPELPAITLEEECYSSMFGGCTSLVTAPELPVANLFPQCYSGMFAGCTSLTEAPELPAITLQRACYSNMFAGCTSLTEAPELPAAELVQACYRKMFSGCTSLNYIKALFITAPISATIDWVSGVHDTGTFVKSAKATWDTTGPNGVPEGWTIETASY